MDQNAIRMPPKPVGRNLLLALLLTGLGYYVTGRFGLELSIPPGDATAIWPPSGIALAAVLLFGRRAWLGIFLASVALHLVLPLTLSGWDEVPLKLGMPVVLAAGATAQAVVGGILCRWFGYPNRLAAAKQIGLMMLAGGIIACFISASVGAASLSLAGIVPLEALPRFWATWWGGDVMGVFVFTPMLLCCAWGLQSKARPGDRRRAAVVCVWVAIGFGVAVGVEGFSVTVARDKLQDRFTQQSQDAAGGLSRAVEAHLRALASVESYFAGGTRRGFREFALFSQRVRAQAPAMQALEWLPRIRESERAEMTRWLESELGFPFHLKGWGKSGVGPIAPGERDEYFPIGYAEPLETNRIAFGVDIASEPVRAITLRRAAETGEVSITGRLSLLQGGSAAVLMDAPIYEGGETPSAPDERFRLLRGYAQGALLVDALVRQGFSGKPMEGMNYWLLDVTGGDWTVLSDNNGQPAEFLSLPGHGLFGHAEQVGMDYPMMMGGRKWLLRVAPTPEFFAKADVTVNWLVLFAGLLMTGMVGAFVLVATGREEELQVRLNAGTAALRRQYESMRLLNNIAAMPQTLLADQLAQALRLGLDHLGLDNGIVSHIEGDRYLVVRQVSPARSGIEDGAMFHTSQTYCSLALETGDALAIGQMSKSIYSDQPCYGAFQFETYIGAPLIVSGRLFGTVNFSSARPYHRPFEDGDLEFIRLLARWIGTVLERDEASRALLSAHVRISAILDNTPVGIAIVDFRRQVVQANRAFCATFGLSQDEVVGQSARVLYGSDESFENIGAKALPKVADGLTFDEDVPMVRADGQPILVRLIAHMVDIENPQLGIAWAAEDVTQRRTAEEALRQRQEFFEQIFESGAAIKLLIDPETGVIGDANPAAAKFYGYPLDRLRGMPIWELDRLAQNESLAILRAAGKDVNSCVVCRHRRSDGSLRDIEFYAGAFRVRGRNMMLVVIHDITERLTSEKLLAQALREKESQARELARSNTELEQFAYVASHDLRQPLRQVASYVTLLDRMYGDKLDGDAKEFIAFARNGAERMDRLIVDLLEYSRIGRKTKELEPVPLAEAVRDAGLYLDASVKDAGGELVIEPMDAALQVQGNRIELERLMQNLIGNALKYRSPERAPKVTVRCVRTEDGMAQISVSDNGIGIAPEHFDRIFGIFQRLHGRDEYEGTGIGLAVCKKIIEHHKGRIWLESTLGIGTTFRVALPLVETVT